MNSQAFAAARAAYQRGDWAQTVAILGQACASGEVSGEAEHLRGNALMKLGRFVEAADTYGRALADTTYAQNHAGALNCNRGRALVAAGLPDAAISCFEAAAADTNYATPYKAQLALGNLYAHKGMAREAGVAWRNAAIDETNPDPSSALTQLGGCFLELGRPADAIEAYRTALDFSSDERQGAIYAQLGQAYMAANRVAEAVDAFSQATADGSYQLSGAQSSSLDAARKAMSAIGARGLSETDQMLANSGYDQSAPSASGTAAVLDPLDPAGKSGEFIPSPEDTGFFSVTEDDLMKADKHDRKMRRKHSHRGRHVVLVILLVLVVLAGLGGYGYYRGIGWPTQEAVTSDLFSTASSGADISAYVADSVSAEKRSEIESLLPTGSTASISGVDRDMQASTAYVTATLASGGTQNYLVSLVRSGVGWKVTNVELSFLSQSTGTTSTTTSGTLDTSTSAQTTSTSAQTTSTSAQTTSTSAQTTSTSAQATSTSAQATSTSAQATN